MAGKNTAVFGIYRDRISVEEAVDNMRAAGFRTGHSAATPAFLQEGGPPVAGFLDTMDAEVWKSLDDEFLKVQ